MTRKPISLTARAACRVMAGAAAALVLSQCASTDYTLVSATPEQAVMNETFGFRKWERGGVKPDTVIIGIHGFCGAAIDYENLGKYLQKKQPRTALYAYEVRGQGRDPLKARRGDIDNPQKWFSDLEEFSRLVRKDHPGAKVVWFGESMGALIAANTYHEKVATGAPPPCDAMVLSSPVVKFRDDFPKWKKDLVREVAKFVPTARVSLESISGQPVQMTHDTVHSEQAETNSWHIEKHTLRLLVTLGELIDRMPDRAKEFSVPVLVLHGGKDFFSRTEDVKAFYGNIPGRTGKSLKTYPDAYHLLMYDQEKDRVISDVADWVSKLPPARRARS